MQYRLSLSQILSRISLLSLLALTTLPGCGPQTGAGSESGGEGSNAPDFTLNDIDGKQVSLSQYLGKSVIVMSFWATWCKPCLAEMPHLQKMYDAKKDKGFTVLAVSMDGTETEAMVAPTIKNKGYTFPVLLDSETRATTLYNPRRAAPFTVIIDKKGKVFKSRESFNPGDEVQLEADVDAAMNAK